MGLKNDTRKVRLMLAKDEDSRYKMGCPFCGRIISIYKREQPAITVYDSITGKPIYEATCEDCRITYSSEFLGCLHPIEGRYKY